MGSSEDRYEIAFFDVETTIPTRPGMGHAILEFGSILVCPRKLVELNSYSTLVRPTDLSLISSLSVRCNGITRDAVLLAPTFGDIADRVYDILHGFAPFLLSLHLFSSLVVKTLKLSNRKRNSFVRVLCLSLFKLRGSWNSIIIYIKPHF